MNRYPWWKHLIIAVVLLGSALYALPNVFGEDPSVQISPARGAELTQAVYDQVLKTLDGDKLAYKRAERSTDRLLVRFVDTETQLKAADVLRTALGNQFVVALNLAPDMPGWLERLGLRPMYLGLDLRGGVHFLMEVDMNAVIRQAEEGYADDVRSLLREQKVRYASVGRDAGGGVRVRFASAAERDQGRAAIEKVLPNLQYSAEDGADRYDLKLALRPQEIQEKRRFALQQNITILRNRVNELGVAEPVIQQQGESRIVVQLPGVQDTARAKEILGATATLEFHMVSEEGDAAQVAAGGRAPLGAKLYKRRDTGQPILLERRVMLKGDSIIDAASGFDPQTGGPMVSVTLDASGAKRMEEATKDNIGKPMAVVFIENKVETREIDGKLERVNTTVEEVINVAVIRDRLSKRFQITGLDNANEARDLALLLRAGALAAPIQIVEERTVGPSAGKENIEQGFNSALISLLAIMVFMAWRYKVFGIAANLGLLANVVLLVATLSMLQATLTLPGIAGIVLTMGMAVDANVLIYERIREELKLGNSPQAAIHAGFEKAFGTIADSNITTLIAGLVLFGVGSGPVKGFAVTLCIGILTSMFSAIMIARAVVNLIYGGRKVERLSI
ncbi:MAG TPA: protein translocase subunit SecD [Candidatus Competibacteraceae bacterium]|nr:protein translocase subunit SecD [Candidatus Competibacteraceae bacterium]